jgi:hypothetical protein
MALALCAAVVTAPGPAVATDNLEYIIPAAIGGAVALILIIAIIMADHDDDEMEFAAAAAPAMARRPEVRFAPDCPSSAAGMPLLCW